MTDKVFHVEHGIAQIACSAIVDPGKKTARVRVKRAPKVKRQRPEPKRYRQDKSARGQGAKTVCISLPKSELAALEKRF